MINTTTESVYFEIRSMILRGEFSADKKINQSELAKKLKVSRTPVTKALHMLEVEGLVDNIPNRGFFVHVPTLREIIEIFMLRQGLEMVSAMYAAEFSSIEEINELESLFAPFIGQEHIDYESYLAADKDFHLKLFQMCDNSLMHKINESMHLLDRSFMPGLVRPPSETLVEHLSITEALRNRDPVKAQELIREHTDRSKHHLLDTYRNLRALGIDTDNLSIFDAMRGK